MNLLLTFEVPGKPRTQGSMTLWQGANGKEHAKHSDHTMNHRNLAISISRAAWGGRPPITSAVAVSITASFARPASHYGTGRNAEILKASAPERPISRAYGDGDKIGRLILDALEIAGVYADDSQVVVLRVEKVYGLAASTAVEVWG
jgi:crossover junction endodeoxyribonuclease RusA